VNETFARRYLPNENPIGRRIQPCVGVDPRWDKGFEIIGVVGDVKNSGLQAPVEPEVTIPYTITGAGVRALMVRTAAPPGAIMNAVRQAVWAEDSNVALIYPSTFEDRLNEQMYAGPRFGMICMAIFGCIGLVLVTLGVYSVLAYSTVQRTHEIGIRMALGAQASDALAMVVKAGFRLVLAGIAIGIPLSLVLGRVIGTQLVGVTVYDPLTLVATTGLLTMTAAIACWIPARRAARVDPMVALRCE
jgi:putative ABC transport system permease protein